MTGSAFKGFPIPFPIGTRVVVIGDEKGFPDGTTGVVTAVPGLVQENAAEQATYGWPKAYACDLFFESANLRVTDRLQWIEFDAPVDDGSGDGPYTAAAFPIQCLRGA